MIKDHIGPEKAKRVARKQRPKEQQLQLKAKLTKRDIFKKGFYYLIANPIIWPYLQFKSSRKNIKSSTRQFRENLQNLKRNRDPWTENAPDMSDFRRVMRHWGINEDEIDRCVSGMQTQIFIFASLGLWGAYLSISGSLMTQLQGLPLILIGLLIVITRVWRIQVLVNRRFVFFKDWFLWGMFAWVGKETPIARKERLREEARYE